MASQTLKDLAYRTVAAAFGAPVDITQMVMRPFGYSVPERNVVGGSEWIGKQMEDAGLISSARAPLPEFAASLISPTGVVKGIAAGATKVLPAFAGIGAIKDAGNFSKKLRYPTGYEEKIITPVRGTLPESNLYDQYGMFNVDAAATGNLRALSDGGYIATVVPDWLSKTKPYYVVGNSPEELISKAREFSARSDRAISSSRASKIPKEVKQSIESLYGKDFSYDISNAANSSSYYITHKPTGVKVRVSDHDLPSYYENTSQIDIRPDQVNELPELLSSFIATKNGTASR